MPTNPSKLDVLGAVSQNAEYGQAFHESDAGLYGWGHTTTHERLKELERSGEVHEVAPGVWELKPENSTNGA
jgi:hypothetical protein